jgi:hypothetical protein
MGRWGELLFEGDDDLDIASCIAEDAGIEWAVFRIFRIYTAKPLFQVLSSSWFWGKLAKLHKLTIWSVNRLYNYEIDTSSEYDLGGRGLVVTRDHLNNGVLARLFKQYSTQKSFHNDMATKEMSLVFLGKSFESRPRILLKAIAALAMRVGATIDSEYMDLLRANYTKIPVFARYSLPLFDSGFRGPLKRQFEIAVVHYKNDGTPYSFYAPRCELTGCDKAEDELPDGQKLLKCG